MGKLPKTSQWALLSFHRFLQRRPLLPADTLDHDAKRTTVQRQNNLALPQEDLMERAADLLEDTWSRKFFMTVCGLTRLAERCRPEDPTVQKRVGAWIHWRYPFLETHPSLDEITEAFIQQSRIAPNWNITFKRLTAILTLEERTVLAEGLLDCLANKDHCATGQIDGNIVDQVEEILAKLLLSEERATECLDQWMKKTTPPSLPIA